MKKKPGDEIVMMNFKSSDSKLIIVLVGKYIRSRVGSSGADFAPACLCEIVSKFFNDSEGHV